MSDRLPKTKGRRYSKPAEPTRKYDKGQAVLIIQGDRCGDCGVPHKGSFGIEVKGGKVVCVTCF